LKGITGRVLPGKMTLLLGPPGSGKSVLLKALSGRLRVNTVTQCDGSVLYNGLEKGSQDNLFLVEKLCDYIEQDDRHAATLTVSSV